MIANTRIGVSLLGLLLAGSVGAANFSVTPLRLDLAGNRSASVEITNSGNEPVDLEVHAKTWTQVDGKDVHSDTSDLSFYPAKFTLPANGKRVVRITSADKAGLPDMEKAYRLYITELPPLHRNETNGENIVVLTSFGLPVFVHQATARAQLTASVEGSGAGSITIRLTNQGKAHAHLTSISSDPAGISSDKVDEWYVLAGASHVYTLPISGNVCSQSQVKLRISVDQGKPVEVPISIPAGTCKSG
jgi:fimbrial chaperone protein